MIEYFFQRRQGFTLPEVLIVVGILAILAFIAIVAIDPAKRFQEARDSRRLTDVQSMVGALQQYTIDHKGELPADLDTREKQIGTGKTECSLRTSNCTVERDDDCIDLTDVLEPYLHGVPEDPKNGTTAYTHYTLRQGLNNEIIIQACDLTEKTQ